MPTINIRSQRHSTIFSTVLTRMTIIGKVKNMNQMHVKNDFFISSKVPTIQKPDRIDRHDKLIYVDAVDSINSVNSINHPNSTNSYTFWVSARPSIPAGLKISINTRMINAKTSS